MDKKIIIAIDGHSSCGKSTFAKKIAKELGYSFVDTGAMYRTVTYAAIQHNCIASNDKIISLLSSLQIEFKFNPQKGSDDIYLNGVLVKDELRTMEVNSAVSSVSSIKEVREFLVAQQQKMGEKKGVVMDGRDIGTAVFPNAELKIFMTASPKVRALRRFKELSEQGTEVTLEEIIENVTHRDFLDENREESPLRRAEDAILLDNSTMSVEQQMEWVRDIIKCKLQ